MRGQLSYLFSPSPHNVAGCSSLDEVEMSFGQPQHLSHQHHYGMM